MSLASQIQSAQETLSVRFSFCSQAPLLLRNTWNIHLPQFSGAWLQKPFVDIRTLKSAIEVMPKRPPRANECYALDKDLAAAATPGQGFDIAQTTAEGIDAPNWANLFLGHWCQSCRPKVRQRRIDRFRAPLRGALIGD